MPGGLSGSPLGLHVFEGAGGAPSGQEDPDVPLQVPLVEAARAVPPGGLEALEGLIEGEPFNFHGPPPLGTACAVLLCILARAGGGHPPRARPW